MGNLETKFPLPSFRSSLSPRNVLSTRASRLIESGTFNSQLIRALFASDQKIFRSYGVASVSAADLKFGQPVYETHPHILKAGELTPGITAQEYADRRAALANSMSEGGVAVLH